MVELFEDQIPDELKRSGHWVHWKFEFLPDYSKPTKVPLNPYTGKKVSVVDSKNWSSFSENLNAFKFSKFKPDGIGVIIKDELIGIDLDDAIDPQGILKPEAKKIVDHISSYWEKSPSGKGMHGYIYGNLPKGHRTRQKLCDGSDLEVYSNGRYFTVTGNRISETCSIARDQELADWLLENYLKKHTFDSPQVTSLGIKNNAPVDNSELIEKILKSKQGAKFDQLFYKGDIWEYPSPSEADLALCQILAFWTGKNFEQIDSYFRQSDLMRGKWDEQRGDSTYGQLTIEKAISQTSEVYQTPTVTHEQKKSPKKETSNYQWQEPEPLKPERAVNTEPYPIDALSPIIRESVKEFISYTPVPDALVGSVALGVAALASQHHAEISIDSQLNSPISLFFLIEQASGERKSTVSRAFLKPVFRWERDKKEQYNHDPDSEEKSPSRIIYEDSTKESLIMDLAEGHKSAALWSDEAGLILGGAGMNENSPMGYLTLLNKAYHGDKLVHRRKQAKSAEVDGYRLSCMLMMQGSVLSYLLNLGKAGGSGWAEDTGFVSRFLFASPPSLIGSREYSEAPEETPALDRFYSRVSDLLSVSIPYSFEDLKRVQFGNEAKQMWIEEYNRVERLCAPGREYAGFGGIVSKHAERIARIAGVLSVFEDQLITMNAETMHSAIELGKWHLTESLRIIGAGSLKPETNDALNLLEWLKNNTNSESDPLTKGDLLRIGPIRTRNIPRRDAALKVLAGKYWLRIVTKGKKQVIEMNPNLNEE